MTEKRTPRTIAVLNLSGPLAPKLAAYFSERKIPVVDGPSTAHAWTHILTKDLHDFSHLEVAEDTVAKDIRIVSLTPVHNPQSFAKANGRLIYDPLWLRSSLGNFILDKFFQEFGGVSPAANYPKFKEIGSYNIINPFSTGEFLDRLVYDAYQAGMNGLAVKSFFDHLVMFLAGLKAKGKMGWPVEVSYGSFDGVFGVQLHFFSKSLLLKEITASLGDVKSRKTEEYLLNLSVQASDFFDFTYLSDVKKVVVTGLWTSEPWMTFENRGFMFNDLTSKSKIAAYPEVEIALKQKDVEPGDLSSLVKLPKVKDDADVVVVKGTNVEEEEEVTVVSGGEEEEEEAQVVKGGKPEKETSEVVSGGEEEEEQVQLVKGSKDKKDNSKTVVGGGEEEAEAMTIIKGTPAAKKGAMQLKQGPGVEADEESDMVIISGGDVGMKGGQFNVKTSGKKDEADLKSDLFIVKGEDAPKKKASPFSHLQQKKPEGETDADLESDVFIIKGDDAAKKKKKPTNFNQPGPEGAIEDEESDLYIVKGDDAPAVRSGQSMFDAMTLKTLNNEDKSDPDAYVKHLEQPKVIIQADDEKVKALDLQVKTLSVENETLRSKLKTLVAEIRITKEAKAKLAEINRRAGQLNGVTDENKKILLESQQKEQFFLQELERSQRQLKSKEVLIEKNREMNANAMAKKDEQILELQQRIDAQNAMMASNLPQTLQNQIKVLERDNENQLKMMDMYKAKIATLTANMEKQQNKDDGESVREENRKLQMANTQMKNQLDFANKEVLRLTAKAEADTTTIAALKAEKLKNDQLLKKATFETKKTTENGVSKIQHEIEVKKLTLELNRLEHINKDFQRKLQESELKLQDAIRAAKAGGPSGGDSDSKGKMLQLETSVKKLTQDLAESRTQMAEMKKEANKLRQDKTAQQNTIDKLKKDLEKANGKAPKGAPGGGKAA